MEPHWKEIIPADRYIVSVDGPKTDYDDKVLTLLYQPLIGPICISLYVTLRNQVAEHRLSSEPVSHYYIMNLLDLGLPEIYKARQKLEGIGLLQTFVKNDGDHRFFIYRLKSPLSPQSFFSDGLLNIYLYQKIGSDHYQKLKQFFSDIRLPLEEYENITKEFQDVFSSTNAIPPYQAEDPDDAALRLVARNEPAEISVQPEKFDFELFIEGLSPAFVNRNTVIQARDVILKLSFLYNIGPLQMQDIVLQSVDESKKIDIEKLRKNARDWYTIEHYQSFPRLVDKVQSPIFHSGIDEPKTHEERLIRYFETVSPRQVLEDMSEGSEPSNTELKLIEDIMLKQKLEPGVVNVLIHYCMLRTDKKLNRGFVETIASHWARKKVKTVKEAMELAKDEHRKYVEWQKNKKQKKHGFKQLVRTEKVPEWFENRQQIQDTEEEVPVDIEEEKRKLQERLQKYKKK